MRKSSKSKEELLAENEALRKKVAEFEDQENRYHQVIEELAQKNKVLDERIKELDCLYKLSRLMIRSDITDDHLLQSAVELIPPAWQYPEVTCARIVLNEKVFKTNNFKATKWKQSSGITVYGEPAGSLEVYYLKKMPQGDEGPFLKEERDLIDAFAQNLGNYLERRETVKQIHRSRENLRVTMNSIGDGIIATDLRGRITQMNPVAENLTGWSFEQAHQQAIDKVFRIVNARTGKKVANPVSKVRKTGKVVGLTNHTKLISKSGTEYHIADSGSPVIDNDGHMTGMIIVFRDVTGSYLMQERLKLSEKKYRTVFENTGAATAIVEKDGTLSLVNSKFAELAGYSVAEIENKKNWVEFTFHEDLPELQKQWTLLYNDPDKALNESEYRFIDHYGNLKYIYLHTRRIPGTDQSVTSMLDITKRKQAENNLRDSEEHYRRLFNTMSQGVIYQDADGTISSANPAAERILGLTFDQMRGRTSMDPHWKMIDEDGSEVPGTDHPTMLALKTGDKIGPVVRGVYHPDKDNHVWLSITATPLFNEGETKPYQAYAIFEDISEKKKSEQQLKLLSRSVEQSPVSILITDQDGRIEYTNPAFTEITGYSFEEVRGKNPNILQSGHHSQDFYKNLWDTILSGQEWAGEMKNKKKNGDFFWEQANISPVLDDHENITHYIAIKEDITERIENEKIIEKNLREKEVLLEEVHHRVKNNMAVIASLLMLESHKYSDSQTRQVLMEAETRIRSMALVHEKLYQSESFSEIPMGSYIKELAVHIKNNYCKEGLDVHFDFDLEDISISITYSVPLGIIVNELITNSLKHAFPDRSKGRIFIGINRDNGRIVMTYQDDGVGIGDAELKKNQSGNTDSLGMELLQGLVRQINGRLMVEDNDGLIVKIWFSADPG